ncbi:MAG: acyl-CoA thioester hydrolase [Cycloclasticus pugetii]|jgi:acyl-CoA thioester hydrolase|uniref:acyl-CoA thioesterase n=1 Tax=Cycloclasticus TaxID=34067 RepID=UPI000286AF97|nr:MULTISPECIES: thioesterase family protein [unclassified Cycloclasticus]AFT67659.1 Thioesterase superfamily protein [Cycloclasticus sp. P1]MBV1898983.1 acyl-CoA thioesterase [Cycloclasticus sp.]
MSKQEFNHVFPLSVRWGDADVYGHINNVEFVRYVESGRVAYCEEVMGLTLKAGIESGWVLADMQCRYLKQVHYPALLEVHTRISQMGNKSATMLVDIYHKGEDTPVLTSRGVIVWFDMKRQQTAPIPNDIKAKVASFEQSVEGVTLP